MFVPKFPRMNALGRSSLRGKFECFPFHHSPSPSPFALLILLLRDCRSIGFLRGREEGEDVSSP